MDIFGILTMLGGLALFLYGMQVMGDGLSKASGGRLERILEKLTSNPIKAVLLGAGVTAVIQSSSATTVMVVGFVNSGIMKLSQTVGIIMGANIGTTATAWILSLSGLEGDNFFVWMLKPSSFSPVLAVIGVCFIMFAKKDGLKDIGSVMVGFAILMFGMDTMSGAVKPLADVPEFAGILTMFSQPIRGLLAGAVFTAIIQSSSASVGILQALSATGAITFGTAIPIIMGQNIGTCVTALLSGIGANKNARRASLIHLYFNIVGTTIFMLVFYSANSVMHFEFVNGSVNAAGIAVVHSIFNVTATVILLPFSKGLERLAYMTIKEDTEADVKDRTKAQEFKLLDPRFLDTPGFAIEQCRLVMLRMGEVAKESFIKATELIDNFSEEKAKEVEELEDMVDRYEDELGTYMVKLGQKRLSEKENTTLSLMLHCLNDFERISDHAVNICESTREIHEKNVDFSKKAQEELKIFTAATREVLENTLEVFGRQDYEGAFYIEPMEEVVDYLKTELKQRHIKRLRKGKCTIEMGFILSDISTNYERVSDHCSNIAICLMESKENGYEAHGYLDRLRAADDAKFRTKYEEYMKKYALP